MSLASAAGALLRPQTPLQQLLEDINFQRNKEMRQLLKDDSGFVVLQGTTYWTDLFVRHFLFQSEPVHSIDSDDLLFFVRKKHVKSSSRHMPKYETEVDVFRKDSRKLPIGDPDVDWEETVYLNMIIHQFDYTLTLAICTRTSPKELQVLRRHSQRVYASPSRRKMDTKGEGEEITYPHICFMVDNFDEVFSDILVRDGEMVCVELVANDKDGAVQGVIFLGSIRYDALKKVYDSRQSSLSSKVAQRMSFGLFSSGAGVQTRCEFVRMKGPQGKGHAEMAVTKPKGSGVETPTSEPGFCATDMWDEWEEENDDYCTYRHQRRLSDPSANLNNFSRYAWRTKTSSESAAGTAGSKARSENEGLDSLANEVSEIEAGDLRDDERPAFSASEAKLHTNPNCEEFQKQNKELEQNRETTTTTTTTETTKADTEPNESEPLLKSKVSSEGPEDNVGGGSGVMALSIISPPNNDPIQDAVEAVDITLPSPGSNNGKTTGCGGNCFKSGKKCKKRWGNSDKNTPQMSQVYCPTCDDANETPACLNKMPDKKFKAKPKTILSVESELVVTKRGSLKFTERKPTVTNVTRSSSLSAADRKIKKPEITTSNKKDKNKSKDKEKEKEKESPKERNKEKVSKTSSLLSKVSPKKLRANRSSTSSSTSLSSNDKTKIPTPSSQTKKKEPVSNGNKGEPNKPSDLKTDAATDSCQEYEIADDAISLNGGDISQISDGGGKIIILTETDSLITVRGKEELPVVEEPSPLSNSPQPINTATDSGDAKPYKFEKCVRVPVTTDSHPLQATQQVDESDSQQSLAADEQKDQEINVNIIDQSLDNNSSNSSSTLHNDSPSKRPSSLNDCNGNLNSASASCNTSPLSPPMLNSANIVDMGQMSATLPRTKRTAAMQAFYNRALTLVPKRRTPDGTNIYYWCDLSKKALQELDDGAYNPLWASRGFAQSFHFWKENRRQQSTPLNAFLTYVTLPWWSIAKDLLDHRETPILTF
ncbi:PHD finger protein rhinoceros isoform X1 [Musca domestica]|uniref:PHD finger protein rhinoceros isoform X1 n=1 Tax=Musca domestica TaxID=7370 RepID=A0A1I8MCV2_MUSDO|nr:PHD finger protein rhinoceros isoform X1 [Musca domestica]